MENKLGETIKSYRKAAKLTQKQLAEKLSKAESTVRMWELGKNMPPLDTLKNIGAILNIPLGDLLLNAGYIDEFKEMVKENLSKPFLIPTFGEVIKDARHDWVDENDTSYNVPLQKIATETGISLKTLENLEKNKDIESISVDELFKLSKALDVIFAYLFLIRERDLGKSVFSEAETDNLIKSLHAMSYSELTFVSANPFEKYLEKQIELNQKYNPNNAFDEDFWRSLYERYKNLEKINNITISYAHLMTWNETKDIRYLINNEFIDMYYKGKKLSINDKEKIVEAIKTIESKFEYLD